MNTLVQIESAVAELPAQDQRSLLAWLQERLTSAQGTTASTPEPLKVFRKLQDEVRLTTEGAAAWKDAVADARR
jgi:hypothetical protein